MAQDVLKKEQMEKQKKIEEAFQRRAISRHESEEYIKEENESIERKYQNIIMEQNPLEYFFDQFERERYKSTRLF